MRQSLKGSLAEGSQVLEPCLHDAIDEATGDVVYLLNISAGNQVLCLDADVAGVAAGIARLGGICHAVNLFGSQACGIKARSSCAETDHMLPFANGSMDACIVNTVRWQTSCTGDRRILLKHLHRVLRSYGQLYLACETRLAPTHRPEQTSEITTSAPRDSMLTLGGYRRLFQDLGFRILRIYAVLPDHRQSRQFVPLDRGAFKTASRISGGDLLNGRTRRWLEPFIPACLWWLLIDSYGFILEKQ